MTDVEKLPDPPPDIHFVPLWQPIERPDAIPFAWQDALMPAVGSPYFGAAAEWYERDASDGVTVRCVIFGNGSGTTPFHVCVWTLPWLDVQGGYDDVPEKETPAYRYPTVEELWDACDLTLDGALFGFPMYMAGVARLDEAMSNLGDVGVVIAMRQASSVPDSAAFQRSQLAGNIIVGGH